MLTRKLTTRLALVAAAIAVAGGAYGIVSATTSSGSSTARAAPASAGQRATGPALVGGNASAGAGSNARSGPAAGGATGTVSSVSKSGFTLTTSAGQKVTVDKAPSTNYLEGTSSISASAITKGKRVLVLGMTNGTTITARQVIVKTTGGSVPASAATVIAFTRGAPTTVKTVGKIPANYSQGSGTIVSGTAANNATEAALAAYPGGIVDRVVKLSNGEYEVHNIGVNWPHHIFVDKDFKVVGAE
jgi:hypothetical protein